MWWPMGKIYLNDYEKELSKIGEGVRLAVRTVYKTTEPEHRPAALAAIQETAQRKYDKLFRGMINGTTRKKADSKDE